MIRILFITFQVVLLERCYQHPSSLGRDLGISQQERRDSIMKKQRFSCDDGHIKPTPAGGNAYADPVLLLHRLLEIGRLALAELDVEYMLTTVMDGVIDIYGAERGMILVFDHAGKTLFEVGHNLSQEDLDQANFEVSRALIEQVKRQGEPICLCHAHADPIPFSALCLPLKRNGEVFGVIYLDHQTGLGKCTPNTCVFFREFAAFISLAAYHALEHKQLHKRVQTIEAELRGKYHFECIVGHHPKIVEILKFVAQVANTEAIVLIQGESGTGKELVAQALHHNSHRRDKPFVPVNCGALPEHLLESELFGHVRGAFTGAIKDTAGWFERADGGTIFLDEVNDMSPALQMKLLRVLQAGEYSPVGSSEIRHCDVRVVAATSQDLRDLVKEGKFREEVYYRLNIVDLQLPSLRDRKCDIPLLARHFITLYGARYGKPHVRLSSEAEMVLVLYDFPGHVRELENMMQRAVILVEGDTITPEHLAAYMSCGKIALKTKKENLTFKAAKK
jgi:transcriptional regulator with GAF, ATPase, and Fis domain